MERNIIEDTISFIKNFYSKDFSGHDFWHAVRVYNLTRKIARAEGIDNINMEIAALLHDVDDIKIKKAGGITVRNYLLNKKITNDDICEIEEIISQVSYRGNHRIPTVMCAKIVQDADRLDAIGAIGIARAFAYGGCKGQPIYDPDIPVREYITEKTYYENTTSINHFYEKLLKLSECMNTQTAKQMARSRHTHMIEFLKQFDYECQEAEIKK